MSDEFVPAFWRVHLNPDQLEEFFQSADSKYFDQWAREFSEKCFVNLPRGVVNGGKRVKLLLQKLRSRNMIFRSPHTERIRFPCNETDLLPAGADHEVILLPQPDQVDPPLKGNSRSLSEQRNDIGFRTKLATYENLLSIKEFEKIRHSIWLNKEDWSRRRVFELLFKTRISNCKNITILDPYIAAPKDLKGLAWFLESVARSRTSLAGDLAVTLITGADHNFSKETASEKDRLRAKDVKSLREKVYNCDWKTRVLLKVGFVDDREFVRDEFHDNMIFVGGCFYNFNCRFIIFSKESTRDALAKSTKFSLSIDQDDDQKHRRLIENKAEFLVDETLEISHAM